MSEDLVVKYLKDYFRRNNNIWFVKKFNMDDYFKRFKYAIIILSLFVVCFILAMIGLLALANLLYIILIGFFSVTFIIWLWIDLYKIYNLKRICNILNKNKIQVKVLLKKYNIDND